MEKTNRILKIVVAVMAIALVFAFVSISELRGEIDNAVFNYNSRIDALQSSINSIYNNVDEKLKQQASLITAFDFEYGEFDVKNMTAPISVKITPKSVADNAKLFLDLGETTIEMKRGRGTEYTANFNIGIFEAKGDIKLLIKEGNTTKSEDLEWYIGSLFKNYLPELWLSFVFDETAYTKETGLKLEGDIMFLWDIMDEKNKFKNMKLTFKLNSNILAEEDISAYLAADTLDNLEINKTFPDVKAGDTFELYVTAEDEYGYIHQKTLKKITCVADSDVLEEEATEDYIISDGEGNVLYSGKEE